MARETFIVSVLLALGLLPASPMLTLGWPAPLAPVVLVTPVVLVPWFALMAGLMSRHREGWRDARPPRSLVLGSLVLAVLTFVLLAVGPVEDFRGYSGSALILAVAISMTVTMVALPAASFLLARAAIVWLQPRLRVYRYLADYLRVMWVPIGGFAVGYLTIIVLFAGFYGMLERFQPGAFAGAGGGISEWLSFAFFTALGQDYTTFAPTSVPAKLLVGVHLILSAGWALVLFAAVMSSIRPKLDRISRQHTEEAGEAD